MTHPTIPLDRWQPLTVKEVCDLFDGAPFQWTVAGGYAIELFIGKSIRGHADTDVLIFRDEQLKAQTWLKDWRLYAADPPGTLRLWHVGEYLPASINDVWIHHKTVDAWQMQFMISEVEGEEWVSKRSPLIRGKRDDLIIHYQGIPCIGAEVQLLYKANIAVTIS
ncbi:MAG: amino acid transporter [Chloroflexi bacterium]|nr:amino acid transporter [Chloroflexota bacterium]MCC6892911.1 amino acid transporter [Anaerolineae bacterium]